MIGGIQKVKTLQEDEAVLLKAREVYRCRITEQTYGPGMTWIIKGPRDLTPAIEYEIVETRKAIPLSGNEGVYVRDLKSGEVKLVRGPKSYLLGEGEAFW